MPELREAIALCCKKIRLSSHLAERAMTIDGATNQDYLFNLLTDEIDHRHKAKITKYLDSAEFPKRYTPEQFHTDEITFPETKSFQSLLALDFYHQGKNVIMYGGSGTGKTMLSILIGIAAGNTEVLAKFFRTAGLINRFTESHQKGNLNNLKKKLNAAQILILDEFGYVPYDRTGSQLLFDYLSEIHEQKSVILNTNLEFAQWVNVLYDQKMATALIGRLTHHVELILFPGTNYRIRESSINEAFTRMSRKDGSHENV